MSKRTPLTFALDTAVHAPAKPIVKESEVRAKGRIGRQFTAAHILPEAAKQFKLLALQQDKTTKTMLIEAINDLFAKYGLSRIADE